MQRSGDDWEPGPLSAYVGEWFSYWWSLRPQPPKKSKSVAEPAAAEEKKPRTWKPKST